VSWEQVWGRHPEAPAARGGRQQVTWWWRWASLFCGLLGLLLSEARRMPGNSRGSTCPALARLPLPCLQLGVSSVFCLTRPLGKFFTHALVTSCLDYILGSGNWGSGSSLGLFSPCLWLLPLALHLPSPGLGLFILTF
jgi:hypothetical protein